MILWVDPALNTIRSTEESTGLPLNLRRRPPATRAKGQPLPARRGSEKQFESITGNLGHKKKKRGPGMSRAKKPEEEKGGTFVTGQGIRGILIGLPSSAM